MFDIAVKPDYEALLANLRRQGTPRRTHFMELFWDKEIGDAVNARFHVDKGLDKNDPDYRRKLWVRLHRFLGYDYVGSGLQTGFDPASYVLLKDTAAELAHTGGRTWMDESTGPIQTWEQFEKFPWPKPGTADTGDLEWYSKHTPDDMCLTGCCHNVFEYVTWAMGFEPLCFALHDQPDLVDAMFTRIGEMLVDWCEMLLQFDRVKIFFGGDDMGFKTSTMVSAQVLKTKALPWHKKMAAMCHAKDRVYCLHTCGNLTEIMDALIDDVKLDGKHSFEDAIEPVTEAKKRWGSRIALLGGMDMGFMTLAKPEQVRERVRRTLDVCLPGGGYCLGTGNTVANYIPLDNYLAMLDEGRKYSAK
jgi:uroporphyrinogen decarboxylase